MAELNSWIVAIVRPPLIVLRFVVEKAYSALFGWWFDDRVVKKNHDALLADIHKHLGFLFEDFGAQIIPNDRETHPRSISRWSPWRR
jgi:hypothetical protein